MVSPGINPNSPTNKNFYKRNYVDTLELITPDLYIQDDITASGYETNVIDVVINSHINAAKYMTSESSGLYVSAIPNTYLSSIDNISGISQYFSQQNNLTKITPQSFERDILFPIGKTLTDFTTSSEFNNYLSSTLLSSIVNYYPPSSADRTASAYSNTPSGTHKHLINSLSWFYFLNLSGQNSDGSSKFSVQPSAIVASALTTNIYRGKSLGLNDGIKALTDFIFLNYETCAAWQGYNLIPDDFLPSSLIASSVSGPGTSGIQQLAKLKTIVDVIYSPHYSNRSDTKVRDAFEDYISDGTLLTSTETKGPFHRLLKAFSYSMFDRLEEAEVLNLLYDIDECPGEFLPHIANLIGWKLYGTDEARQRLQLKNAVSIYKKTGTKESIQAAVNSLFSDDIFDVSANIYELWESYIPFLIYYALTTESYLFKDFTTWTRKVAIDKGVTTASGPTWSATSMDFNIRAAVDNILLYLVCLHPDIFNLGGEKFPILVLSGDIVTPPLVGSRGLPLSAGPIIPGVSVFLEDPTFQFKYRNRIFPIPPWEQITYYTQCGLTDNFINDLFDLLICFGVSESFASIVREYIKDNTLRVDDSLRDDNGWLMFTSGVNDPPNLSSILQDPTSNKVQMLPLWSGKSSHFKFIMAADSFDFAKNSFTHDSKWAPSYAAKVTKDFAPAHSIPESRLEASGSDGMEFSSTSKWIINPSKAESYEGSGFTVIETPNGTGEKSKYPYFLAGAGVSAVHLDGWRRGGRNPQGRELLRNKVNRVHLVHSGVTDAEFTEDAVGLGGVLSSTIYRNNIRRRDYKNTLPSKGYYDRTGFNMPISWDSSTIEYSYSGAGKVATSATWAGLGMMPLGYIASGGRYQPINDFSSIPGVYKNCENLTSPNTFSGVDTSNTFPCRGLSALGADAKHTQYRASPANYIDRGQAADIIETMHRIKERQKLEKARYYVSSNFDSSSHGYANNDDQFNTVLSFANSSTESDGWFPNSMDDYYNYKFERGLHQVYDSYTDNFKRHGMNLIAADVEGGPLIHAHLYGNGFFNGSFRVTGPSSTLDIGEASPSLLIASAMSEVTPLTLSHSSFSGIVNTEENWTGSAYGSYLVSAGSLIASSLMVSSSYSSVEIRNRNIISGMDLIHPSGADVNNSFQLFNIASKFSSNNSAKNYHISNPLIKLKSINGLSRVRTSVKETSGLIAYSPYYLRDDNVLYPDRKYVLKVRYMAGTENGQHIGVAPIGVWIHTELENNTFWTYTNDNKWVKNDLSSISEDFILSNSHYHSQTLRKRPQIFGRCGALGTLSISTSSNPSVISDIVEDDYTTMEVDFHTFNKGLQRRDLVEEPYGSHFVERPSYIDKDLKQRIEDIGDLHTEDQNYVVEVFMVPNSQNINKFILVDHIGLLDKTLNEKITYEVSGEWHPAPFSVLRRGAKYINPTVDTYTPEDIQVIFKFFNSTGGVNHYSPYSSRVASETGDIYGVSGGSRLSYRQQPEYYTYTKQANYNNLTKMDIVD